MRRKNQKQMPLTITSIDHPQAVELEGISQILNAKLIINGPMMNLSPLL